MRIDTDYTYTNGAYSGTPMLIWDNSAAQLKRVLSGPPDSGGTGYRALVVEN